MDRRIAHRLCPRRRAGDGIPDEMFGPALRAIGCPPSEEMITELLAGRGTVDLAGFKEAAEQLEVPTKDMVREAFATFDTNSNGYIALGELSHLMKALGEGLSDEQIAGME